MKTLLATFVTALLLLAFTLPPHSQEILDTAKQDDTAREKRVVGFVSAYMDAYQIPGLALAIVKDDQIDLAKAFGVKNLDTKEPMTVESIFHMASVSKPFSATAIMQLVEKGKMKLDDPLVHYLPYFKLDDPRYKDITIKQMLTHTSGIPDVRDYEWDKPQFDDGAAERYVRSLSKEKMIAGPGERWRYSNMAFDILADVIAKVSGMTFEDYIKENILTPLDMKESDFLRKRIKPGLYTSGHTWQLRPQVSAIYPYNRRHAPSSCLNANVVEMSHWAIANMNKGVYRGKRILDESSYKLLFEPQAKIDENRSIGLSWFLEQRHELKTISHGGGDLGFRSFLIMIPEKSLAVIAASNYDGTPIAELALGVLDIMLGFEPQRAATPIGIPLGQMIAEKDVENAIEYYRELKRTQSQKYDFSEGQLNTLGYRLIRINRLNDAVEIFKLNVEMFPNSWNVYDSLGEAYLAVGNKELALENYEKSVKLNPENKNGEEAIKKLKQK
jgi:CubicO group peptidase (beta-lactamase class C family)